VFVDISIDAGGVAQTSRPTTHDDPVFVAEGVVHYCVPNMPAAVPRAGSEALSAAVAPYASALARGIPAALAGEAGLASGVLLWKGRATHEGIATEAGLAFSPLVPADLGA
jgi:alanine dehydrogenase